MAVNNSLAKKEPQGAKKTGIVEYDANGVMVSLSPELVRNYLVSGNKEAVSINELVVFMNLCRFNGLNPWLKEAYCIKYGNEPAAMVIGKETFQKRAESTPAYDGSTSGIIVETEEGDIKYRIGTFKLPGETVIGGFAEVFRKDRAHSCRVEVSMDEYVGRKKDGTLNSQWSKRPATMIRKVALVQALRESFPHNVSGMYTAEEVGQVEPVELPVEVPHDVRPEMQNPQGSQEAKNNSNSVENNSNSNSNISDPQPAPAENPQTEPQQMNAAEAALFGSFK